MRKVGTVAILFLVTWNVILTILWVDFKTDSDINRGEKTIVKQLSSEFQTDYTEVIEFCKDKTVGVRSISSYANNSGSGVVYGLLEDGSLLIVTNYYLVNNNGDIQVMFANRESYPATLIGRDIYSDIALLSVKPDFHVDPFILGDSFAINEGEWILTVGATSANDYYNSYDFGILSGKSRIVYKDIRSVNRQEWDIPLLQMAKSIESESTGGALVNMAGELIGILSNRIVSTMNEYTVAIPVYEVSLIVDSILKQNEIYRFPLGITVKEMEEVPLYLKSHYHIDLDNTQDGLLITNVVPGSIAEKVGFKTGDVLIGMNNTKSLSYKEYRYWLYHTTPQETIDFTVRRMNETIHISVICDD